MQFKYNFSPKFCAFRIIKAYHKVFFSYFQLYVDVINIYKMNTLYVHPGVMYEKSKEQ